MIDGQTINRIDHEKSDVRKTNQISKYNTSGY